MPKRRLLTITILALLLGAAVLLILSGVDSTFVFNKIYDNRDRLASWVEARRLTAAALFVAAYVASTAVSLPGAVVMTMAAGFLFGTVLGTLLSVAGATLGAVAVFLFARSALGEPLRARGGPAFRRLEAGFRANALSYLIFLRLIPVFPFWLVNLVPALVGMPAWSYALGTLVGIIPGSLVFVSLGRGFDVVFRACDAAKAENPAASCAPPAAGDIFLAPEVLLPLAGLGLIALAPALLRRLRRRGSGWGEANGTLR